MSSTSRPLEQGSDTELDSDSSPPVARRVPISRPLEWLRLGWQDFRSDALLSAGYGVVFAIAGWELLIFAQPRPYLFTAALSGFMLIAPMLAAGLYEISRRHAAGLSTHFRESLEGWTRNGDAMALFGLVLAVAAIAWERISAILFALFYGGSLSNVESFVSTVFLSGAYPGFVVAYVVVGALLAGAVFAMSAISVPMLVDRDTDVVTAIVTSCKAVELNPGAMLVWAALLVLLMAVGFATFLIGMVVLLPVAAHASFHAYRDLTGAVSAARPSE